MKGCRPLTDEEVQAVLDQLDRSRYPARNRALFLLGLRTGFRISELLSLTLGDIIQNGNFVDEVLVARRNMKKKREGRKMFLHEEAKAALEIWTRELAAGGHTAPETMLFRSRNGANRAIHRNQAGHILWQAYAACGLTGKIATHSMRKTFAKRMKLAVKNDLQKLQKLMGHAQITSTMSYIEIDEDELKDAVLKS